MTSAPAEGRGEPPDPPVLVVRGGAGGTRACLEALLAAADRADRAAAHLCDAAGAARRGHLVAVGTAGAGQAAEALAALAWGPAGIGVWSNHAADLAAALRGAVAAYAAADRDAAAWFRAALVVGGRTLGEAGPGATAATAGALAVVGGALGRCVLALRAVRGLPGGAGLLLTALTGPDARSRDDAWGAAARLLGGDGALPASLGLPHGDGLELLVPGIAAWLLGAAPGTSRLPADPVRALAAVVAVSTAAWAALVGTDRPRLLVAPLLGCTTPTGRPDAPPSGAGAPSPTGVADVLREVAALGDEPGPVVGVDRLDHADGSTSWLVAVPGTRSLALGGADPMDSQTNVALIAGRPDPMTAAVEEAMLRAGIGPDEPVVLAGHSQGGMVATRVAAALEGTFTVAAVVTAGSPVGSMPTPQGVPVLHLEHAQDWVPALDGRPNPDTPTRTTVVRTLPAAAGPGSGLRPGELGGAHEAWRYAETAAVVDADDSRSVQAFRGALTDALGDGTAQVSRQRYVVVRVG